MTQEQLAHTLFPLGGLTKAEARRLAAESGFVNAGKPDSQDICFVPDGDYAAAIERLTARTAQPGPFVGTDGRPLGTHRGIIRYTIGQHRGLGLDLPDRYFVCRICPATNTVVLGREEELYSREAVAGPMRWISGQAPSVPFRCAVRIRYRQAEQAATVTPLRGGAAHIAFDRPQRAVTPGQAAVLYDGDTVLGGGVLLEDGGTLR